ncbi:hypothetical protein ACFL6R_01395 [Gemmatimonadota bacterium]
MIALDDALTGRLVIASKTDDLMAYHAMIMLLNLPVLFLSNALYPMASLPG